MAGTIAVPLVTKNATQKTTTISYGTGRFDSKDYVNGGVTWDLAPFGFTSPPQVFVTILLKNLAFNAAHTLSAVVEILTATSAKIRVTKNDGTAIAEVATGDVTLQLFAIGD